MYRKLYCQFDDGDEMKYGYSRNRRKINSSADITEHHVLLKIESGKSTSIFNERSEAECKK